MIYADGAPGRFLMHEGRRCLFFSGYSYLGMSSVPDYLDLVAEGHARYGALFPSSRVSNTRLRLYDHLERYLSQLTGREATVTYSSGFLACQAAAHALKDLGPVLVAPDTHPATGLGGTFPQADSFDDWCARVLEFAAQRKGDTLVLVLDAVNPLKGEVRNLIFLQELPRKNRYVVLVDDSHGIGWMGRHGEGISGELMHLPHVDYLLTYSLSKAFHAPGGAVSGSAPWAEKLRSLPHYTASSPMGAGFAHALLNGGSLYEVQRSRLEHNLDLLRARSADVALEPTRTPVFLCPRRDTAEYLGSLDILISSFAYPDPAGPLVNRVVVSALHEAADFETLVAALKKMPDSG